MKKTKIVATISDHKCDESFIQELYDAGMNVVRINTAHQTPDDSLKIIENVRKVSDKIAILIDTKGPELRTMPGEGELLLEAGKSLIIKGSTEGISSTECLYINYNHFVAETPVGSHILIDDGLIEIEVKDKHNDELHCIINNTASFKGKKSVNIPGVPYRLPSLNDKDRSYIQFAIEQSVDFIAHSFVRNKADLLVIQEILNQHKSKIKLIAKIENQEGVDNIDEILDHCYGIMVARGDLAIEVPYERIPIVQMMLTNKCIERRKPVIIATQMLHSMIKSPRPTRAEVTDIANAILGNADAIMLSGETAFGDYPVESVKTMTKISLEVESAKEPFLEIDAAVLSDEISAYLTKSAVKASNKLNAKAILADTTTGRSIRNLAAYRGARPIYAKCYDKRVVRELALSYGVYPEYMRPAGASPEFLHNTLKPMLIEKLINEDDVVIVVAGNFGALHGASFIEISTVKNLMALESMGAAAYSGKG